MTESTDTMMTDVLEAKRRDVRRVTLAMIVIMAVVIAGAAIWLADLSRSRDYWRADSDKGWEAHSGLSQTYSDLYDEFVRETGHLPYAEAPSEATDPSGATSKALTIPGPTGPTGQQGVPGKPGKDGRDGEDGQDGESIPGAPGADGADGLSIVGEKGDTGAPGEDGESIVGPAGKDGTNGKDGADGKDGAPGKDGRGIATLTCDPATGIWTVTYTDGESAAAGPCIYTPEEATE